MTSSAATSPDNSANPPRKPRLPPLRRIWTVRGPTVAEEARALQETLRLPLPLCQLLVLRGHKDIDSAKLFLKPRLDRLHDPFGLTDMQSAVDRLNRALERGETILVHGDYDVDGVCGTTLYTRVLRAFGARVVPFTPSRLRDGYDLTVAGVAAAVNAGATLIVTADCGTVAHAAVAEAAACGIDVIITDHHTPSSTLPSAAAVINPNRADSRYADRSLAGAGVAYKLCQALVAARGGNPSSLWYYLDLVAIATIADLAPLRGENRIFTRFGLRVLAQTRNVGLRALLASAGVDASMPIGSGQVSHGIGPRINAVGRMGDANRAVSLLLTEDAAEAARLAAVLEEENRIRKAVDRQTLHEALEQLEQGYDPDRDYGVVLAARDWHPGVIGIVASRVVERINRPTIMIALDSGSEKARGSARSIPGFHLYEAIRDCGHLLMRFGGHRQAAGLDIAPEQIESFRAAFNQRAHDVLGPDDVALRVPIDIELQLCDANVRLVELLRHFGPFGIGNPSPMFASRQVRLLRPPRIVREEHAKLWVSDGTGRLEVIGFGMAERLRELRHGDTLDIAYHLQLDDWNGRYRPQARLCDFQKA